MSAAAGGSRSGSATDAGSLLEVAAAAAGGDPGERDRIVPGGDPFEASRPLGASGLLAAFAAAGVVESADSHVARALARLGVAAGGEVTSGEVLLALALAVRALRLGSVCVDLAVVASSVSNEGDGAAQGPAGASGALAWPEPARWLAEVAAHPLVATVPGATVPGATVPGATVPGAADGRLVAPALRLEGSRLYLDRYWRDECLVAAAIEQRCRPAEGVDVAALAGGLSRLFRRPPAPPVPPAHPADRPGEEAVEADLQQVAAANAILAGFSVVSGGPGTGKTTTVARLLALVHEQAVAAGRPAPLVALAAPTGKAAARLEQAVREAAAPAGAGTLEVAGETRDFLASLHGSTLHRLLGRLPGSEVRFRHDAHNHLPHDLVVVDEVSMVSLSLMARLLEAVRPGARLVLVGDHEQLASVEAGSVLGDIVGPAALGLRLSPSRRAALERAGVAGLDAPARPDAAGAAGAAPIGDAVVVLRRVHRYKGAIAELAAAIQRGDADTALAVLYGAPEGLSFVPLDGAVPTTEDLAPARRLALVAARATSEAALAGDGEAALAALGGFRLLCANRRGPAGVAVLQDLVEGWVAAGVAGFGSPRVWAAGQHFYPGLPLLVTENDYDLRLYNGDAGVVVAFEDGRLAAVFESAGPSARVALDRLGAVERCFASTVHKSQGSQFDAVAVVLPPAGSPILSRELLYTAVTRARREVVLVGSPDAVRAALARPIARASGLAERLWHPPALHP